MRDNEKKLRDEYLSSLKSAPMDLPRVIRFGSEGDDIEEVRLQIMKSMIDPKNFDLFLDSPFGKYLLEGINDEEKVEKRGITKVSEFIKVENNYKKAMQKAKFDACLQ